ncbi:MAG: hypothetical protein DRP13_00605 [Candidatus Aenigmatarchaeota archaeon]|nr:MAG: hypothetical protein DRP13_00605 [Candidatus Aenigmarchaeota archaeon]
MMEIAELERYNPWWKTGKAKKEWLEEYKRKLYYEVLRYVNKRQMILIQGLRRTGKTTLLFQLVQNLLDRNETPKNIVYFSFDEIVYDIKEVLEAYQKFILKKPFGEIKNRVYIFLDELQKVKNWEEKLKVFYDLYPNLKFIVSGSSSISLRKKSKESLAGRVIDFNMSPLEFDEFLEINGYDAKKIQKNPDLWRNEIVPLFYKYLKYGSFPELAKEEDEEFARKYIMNSVIERVIYKDIAQEFEVREVELLKKLLYTIGKNPGMIVNFKEIGKNFGRDERTISNYFEYLEYGLLIKFIFNYRGSSLATMRKLKKVYFTTPNLIFALNPYPESLLPKMLENVVASLPEIRHFYRNNYEIDFISENGKTVIEVKMEGKKLKQVKKFISNKKVKECFIVDFEKEGKENGMKIIPIWKFLLNC